MVNSARSLATKTAWTLLLTSSITIVPWTIGIAFSNQLWSNPMHSILVTVFILATFLLEALVIAMWLGQTDIKTTLGKVTCTVILNAIWVIFFYTVHYAPR